jgi:type I restriction enzyme, S subunit
VAGSHDEARAQGPGVTVGRSGSVGFVSYSPSDFWPLNTVLFVNDFHGNDPRFAYYLLKTIDFMSFNSGSVQPSLNRNFVHPMKVRVPAVGEQGRIGGFLGSLDDKIDVNRRIAGTLDQIARALFKSWFVDFDPVRGTSRVPEDIRRLFPGRLVESRIGLVPESWEVAALAEHVEVTRGLSYTGAGLADEGMPLHNLNSIREGGGYKEDGIKYYVGEYRERDLVRPGDLIVANTDLTQNARVIGSPALVPRSFGADGLFSHHTFRLRPLDGSALTPRWLYLLLVGSRMHQQVVGYSNGTTVNMLPKDGIEKQVVAIPPDGVVERFDAILAPIFDQQEGLAAESNTLAELRDTLLPKLVSGEVRLPPATDVAHDQLEPATAGP